MFRGSSRTWTPKHATHLIGFCLKRWTKMSNEEQLCQKDLTTIENRLFLTSESIESVLASMHCVADPEWVQTRLGITRCARCRTWIMDVSDTMSLHWCKKKGKWELGGGYVNKWKGIVYIIPLTLKELTPKPNPQNFTEKLAANSPPKGIDKQYVLCYNGCMR